MSHYDDYGVETDHEAQFEAQFEASIQKRIESLPSLQDKFLEEMMKCQVIKNNRQLFTSEYVDKSYKIQREAKEKLESALNVYYARNRGEFNELVQKTIRKKELLKEKIPSDFLTLDEYEERILELEEEYRGEEWVDFCGYLNYVREIFL
jgi:hypothetical protein